MSVEAIRGDLVPFAAGVLLLFVGLAALAGGLLRLGARVTLLSFGSFCALYGLRQVARTQPAWLLFAAAPSFWSQLNADVTYLIGAPGALFFAQLLGDRWRRVFTWVAGIVAAYAVAAILVDAAVGRPWTAIGPNAYLVVGSQILGAWGLLRPGIRVTRELRVVRAAFAVLVVFVLNENAPSFGLPSVPRVEWIGVTIFLAGLGYATALRVVNGERRLVAIGQEMETARRIQTSILPRALPRLPGVSLAVRYEPMTAVAGDFYDVVVRDSGLGVLIADVSGHGVPAALVASMVKVAFAAQAPHAEDPGRVLAGVNRTLCDSLEGAYVTAAYAWLDFASAGRSYASAGHPPLLLRGASGVERLADNGLLMGLMPDAEYPVTRRSLASGDRLLFYTDGAIEAINTKGEMFELERLIALLESSRDPAAGFADSILASLGAWRGGASSTDDLTLLVLDFEGVAATHDPACAYGQARVARSADVEHDRHRRIARSAAREQPVPAARQDRLLDQLDDRASPVGAWGCPPTSDEAKRLTRSDSRASRTSGGGSRAAHLGAGG